MSDTNFNLALHALFQFPRIGLGVKNKFRTPYGRIVGGSYTILWRLEPGDRKRLAIGAAKFGARAIDAVDIDEAAVAATRLNAEANGVTLNAGLPELAQGQYQTVLANILATPLKVLAPLLCSHVRSGGHLVLAGILARQADELIEAYAPWVALQVSDEEEGWILMTAVKA